MNFTMTTSPAAKRAYKLVCSLQERFAKGLEEATNGSANFTRVHWTRNNGQHGGGHRLVAPSGAFFNRGSVNVSHVHYTDLPTRKLDSATALSTIIHPCSPFAPSVHIHVSWTEMKSGEGYWRVMADLNPAICLDSDREKFATALQNAAPNVFDDAKIQGDKYFYIPALKRHRGVIHFYLEQHYSEDPESDFNLAENVVLAATKTYTDIFRSHVANPRAYSENDSKQQLHYHTLYAFQVLTLDRGTTSGLLVHSENDLGILASLPARIDRELFKSWASRVDKPQDDLVHAIAAAMGVAGLIDDAEKREIAMIVRSHFTKHPEALQMQAKGTIVPPTVANHQQ